METQRLAEIDLRARIAAYAEECGFPGELDGLLLADGFEGAFLGIGERVGELAIAVYDGDKAIEILVASGLNEEEAREHFSFNVTGAWVGDQTPMFITRVR